jgi:hypothetical protein
MRGWSDDRQWWLASIVQHWSSSQILPKTAGDVVEKCIKIFVMAGLEIHNGPSQDQSPFSNPLPIVGSTRDEHTQFG